MSGDGKRRFLPKLPPIDQWTGFLLAAVGLAVVAAAVEFLNRSRGDFAPRALGSLEFGFGLVFVSLLAAGAVWAVIRVAWRNKNFHPGKEGVLWYACILTTVVSGIRLIA